MQLSSIGDEIFTIELLEVIKLCFRYPATLREHFLSLEWSIIAKTCVVVYCGSCMTISKLWA